MYIYMMYIHISKKVHLHLWMYMYTYCNAYFVQDTVFTFFCGQNMTYGVWSSIIIRESKLIPIYGGITALLNSIVELHAIPEGH